jgi:hypothetical protein
MQIKKAQNNVSIKTIPIKIIVPEKTLKKEKI